MKVLIAAILIFAFSSADAQIQKGYIAYFTGKNYRNSEGDVIVKNDGATLYSVWTEFGTSTADDAAAQIVSKTSIDGGKNWTAYKVEQANLGTQTTMSVSLVRINSTTVHMYFLVKNSATDMKIYRKISSDDCATWGAASAVISDVGYNLVLNGKVRKTASGRIVIPIAWVTDAGGSPAYFRTYVYYSDNSGSSWTKSTPELTRSAGIGLVEPGFVETSSNNLRMHIRESLTGHQWYSTSTDNGSTWASAAEGTLSSTSSPAAMIKLSNGHLIALHNPDSIPADATYNLRVTLRISQSTDNGATWSKLFDLERGPNSNYNFSYPAVIENNSNLLVQYWETNYAAGKIALKFASIPITQL